MNENIRAVREACEALGLEVDALHASGNLLRVHTSDGDRFFANWTTPFNAQSVARICEDKAYATEVLSARVRMPRTRAFLDPDTHLQYRRYRECASREEIAAQIQGGFELPVVVKRNRGSLGKNVFLCRDLRETTDAIDRIFDRASSDYDYVCLAQEHVAHVREYRVILVTGELALAYLKDAGSAAPSANLSPLHAAGAVARRVDDRELLATLADFCKPAHQALGIAFCGLDVVADRDGRLTCLEINSSPGFDRYVAHNGNADIVAVYRTAMERLFAVRG